MCFLRRRQFCDLCARCCEVHTLHVLDRLLALTNARGDLGLCTDESALLRDKLLFIIINRKSAHTLDQRSEALVRLHDLFVARHRSNLKENRASVLP